MTIGTLAPASPRSASHVVLAQARQPTPASDITAAQLRQIMPNAGPRANEFAAALNAAMRANGIVNVPQQAAFLAHIAVESGQLRSVSENLNYSATRLMEVWPRRFPTLAFAQRYAGQPEKLANYVYANRNGNGDVASGDGWRFRGGGLMQTTGRANYRAIGLEDRPEVLRTVKGASDSAACFFADNGLVEATRTELRRAAFDETTKTVNGGLNHANERWQFYQTALRTLAH
jgi:putative chitinase